MPGLPALFDTYLLTGIDTSLQQTGLSFLFCSDSIADIVIDHSGAHLYAESSKKRTKVFFMCGAVHRKGVKSKVPLRN